MLVGPFKIYHYFNNQFYINFSLCIQYLTSDFNLFYFILLSFLATPQRMELLGQGSDPSCHCDPSGNAKSLTHCAGQASNSCPSAPKTPTIPLSHSGSSVTFNLLKGSLSVFKDTHIWTNSEKHPSLALVLHLFQVIDSIKNQIWLWNFIA